MFAKFVEFVEFADKYPAFADVFLAFLAFPARVILEARVVFESPLTRASLNSFTVPHLPHSGQRPYHFDPLHPHSEHK